MTSPGQRIADEWARHAPRRSSAGAPPATTAAPGPAPTTARGAQLSTGDVAALAGITATTVRQHARLGRMPPADGTLGGRSWWWEATIADWLATRRGRGRPSKR